jgi:peroxiredoxin (alkyl hydroperoxide reductase subunit C)
MSERVRGVLNSGAVTIGDLAPQFALPALIGGVRRSFHLSDCRGKSVILAFCPFNWEPISLRQMKELRELRPRVLKANGEIIVISVESIMNTTAWERHHGPFDFPICSDFWPHGAVCERYGVFRESGTGAGASERAVFVADRQGRIVFRSIYEADAVPPLQDVVTLIETG